MLTCLKCGSNRLTKLATGRPPVYCSVACRRAAEYEIKRLQRHLARLEIEAEDLGQTRLKLGDNLGRTHRQQVADNRRALAEKETRLRDLLRSGISKAAP